MSEMDAFPLSWPAWLPRVARRERSRFAWDLTVAKARDGLLTELHRLGARNVVISSNVPLRRDGLPYSNWTPPDDPAVAVYFTLNGEDKCMANDRWATVQDNMHAIELSVAAICELARWGSGEMVNAAFQGFAALPARSTSSDAWWSVLGVAHDVSEVEVVAAYRARAKETHPDTGGTDEEFGHVADAYRQWKAGRAA